MLRRPKHAPENSRENIQECSALIYIPRYELYVRGEHISAEI